METGRLKTFAQSARRQLLSEVSTRLDQVLQTDSVETREKKAAISELKLQITQSSKREVIDRVAYTWFNRFCALRYMDVNHYTRIGLVSPEEGYTQPEILQEAKLGVIDSELKVDQQRVLDILSGKIPSSDQQGEAFRLLLVGACNYYHQLMPFLFEPIADYTELLMPADLLSENSILYKMREVLTPETCQDVEVIGWLYQFYIAERKDEVFENLKKNIKIEAKDIPAATQLFTPHWIVRYLVENSLGRLWMLNYPGSRLIEQMEYYIKPVQEETEFLKIESPEEIKVCDPACGSGHMLTYAFDLLYTIYEEQGYDPTQIPSLILQKNLYGIEIDTRAGDLAAFALVMKARGRDKHFFSRKVEPNICVLQNVIFTANEIDEYMQVVGKDLFTQDLWDTLKQFEQADNFGSLIQPQLKNVIYVKERLKEKGVFENLFLHNTNQKVQQALKQVEYLSTRYHVAVMNPPYMGGKGMNSQLKNWAEKAFVNSSSDTYAMFMDRSIELVFSSGYSALITMDSWMFSPAFEEFRVDLLSDRRIMTLAHFGANAFDTISGEVVSTAAFILNKSQRALLNIPVFIQATSGKSERDKELILKSKNPIFISMSQNDFIKIRGAPLAYWINKKFADELSRLPTLGEYARPRSGLTTGDNEKYVRYWHEVKEFNKSISNIEYPENTYDKWVPLNGGSSFRKWYGSNTHVIYWEKNGNTIKTSLGSTMANPEFQFKPGVTWSKITGSSISVRRTGPGFIFSAVGLKAFPPTESINYICGYLNSSFIKYLVPVFSCNITILSGDISKYPLKEISNPYIDGNVDRLCYISKLDWDSYEISWDFQKHPLLQFLKNQSTIKETYSILRTYWQDMTLEMKNLEEDNNRVIIETYGLQDELPSIVPIQEVTLTFNPFYRYGSKKRETELEALLLADTIKEFISYAVGCMFGRYSLDKPSLILVNRGDLATEYLRQIPNPTFPPDDDNVIPILNEGWFTDDITERLKKFLRVTFGDEHYEENLAFIESAIGKDVRSYFLKDFYNEHIQMYKKRPIYWLFSSPNSSFNALIYMHRYRPDTVSVILNNYLREFIRKLNAHKAHLEEVSSRFGGSQAEKTKATKEINELNKVLAELKEYEEEVLYPLATRQIQIDLDDGVKVNYNKFGKALKKVNGLSEK